jgi:aconitase A
MLLIWKPTRLKINWTGNINQFSSARQYKAADPTIVVGDENYGEGSSREHAAIDQDILAWSCFGKIFCPYPRNKP